MRLTSLLPDGEPNCLVLKLRQMLILLDCGLGLEQLYAMPVRKGLATIEQELESTNSSISTATHPAGKRKQDYFDGAQEQLSDIRQDWASFIRSSTIQSSPKKARRSSITPQDYSEPSTSSGASQDYMFKLPDFSGIDLKSVDVVLISNFNHMLSLPYLTEFTDFQGRIFATEPTIEFGRQHMIEFVSFFGTSVSSSPHHFIDRKQLVARSGSGLYPAYTMADIKACIDKIQPVRFREHVSLYGSLKLTAHSAGYCLGSSNWHIQTGTESIAFVSSSSIQTNLHPDLFDGSLLEKANTVIAADLCPKGATSYNSGVNDVCAKVAMTVARKGHVLVPCAISGFLFDLMEDIHLHLNHMGLTHQVQYAFISPVAETALQYSNILAEWMAPRKQEMVYLPEAPLLHGILQEKGLSKNYKSVHGAFSSDLKHPCIVFGGHPSLRSGPMVNLLQMWGGQAQNSIVLVEPRMDSTASLEPFKDLEISKRICPLDIRMSIDQLVDVMRKHKHPKHVLVPSSSTILTRSDGTAELADAKNTTSTPACQWSAYKYAEPLQLGIGSLYETVLLSEELAKGIFPQSFGTTSIAAISGSLSIYNNRMQLEPASVGGRQILALHSQRQLCGTMNLNTLLTGLAMIGVSDPVVTELDEIKDMQEAEIRVEFVLEGKDANIIVRANETIVKCEEASRPLLRGAIVQCFQTL
ncbi:Integrator complex subunit 9 [Podila minutissima]|nr:Integrator complex subunit 9 [Podila minutissima]